MKKFFVVFIMLLLVVQGFAKTKKAVVEDDGVEETVVEDIVIEETEIADGVEIESGSEETETKAKNKSKAKAKADLPSVEVHVGGFVEPFIMLDENRTFGISYGPEFAFRWYLANWFAFNAYARLNIGAYDLFLKAVDFSLNAMFPTIVGSWELPVRAWMNLNDQHPLWLIFNCMFLCLPAVVATLIPIAWTPIAILVSAFAFLSPVNIGIDAEFHVYRNSLIDTFISAGISTDPAKINYTGNPFAKSNSDSVFLPIWPMMNIKAGAQLNLSHFSLYGSVGFETTALSLIAMAIGLDQAIAGETLARRANADSASGDSTKHYATVLDFSDVTFLIGATYRF